MRSRKTKNIGILAIAFIILAIGSAAGGDGTIEGTVSSNMRPQTDTSGSYIITPFESVSIGNSNVWQDNRHRAYYSTAADYVNGFLQFDVTQIPDNEKIEFMNLRCYLEDAFMSPYNNSVVDVYYSTDDGWTRYSITPGQLSLDVLLTDNIPFTTYIPKYDFVLNVAAHDWSQDLIDNRITIGFKNDVNYYSYVYFFGAYGEPTGQPCELRIKTAPASPKLSDLYGKVR